MGEKIGGILWDAMIFAGFVYLLLVMRGKVTPPQPVPLIQKPHIAVKIMIYAGAVLFGLLLVLEFL